MNKPNFSDLLNEPASDVERPKPLPPGTYRCMVVGQPTTGESSQKKTPFIQFTLKPLEAQSDVDPDDLDAMGGLGEKMIYSDRFYLTKDAKYRLKEFLEDCGIDSEDVTLEEMVMNAPNQEVLIRLGHEATLDNKGLRNTVLGTARVE